MFTPDSQVAMWRWEANYPRPPSHKTAKNAPLPKEATSPEPLFWSGLGLCNPFARVGFQHVHAFAAVVSDPCGGDCLTPRGHHLRSMCSRRKPRTCSTVATLHIARSTHSRSPAKIKLITSPGRCQSRSRYLMIISRNASPDSTLHTLQAPMSLQVNMTSSLGKAASHSTLRGFQISRKTQAGLTSQTSSCADPSRRVPRWVVAIGQRIANRKLPQSSRGPGGAKVKPGHPRPLR